MAKKTLGNSERAILASLSIGLTAGVVAERPDRRPAWLRRKLEQEFWKSIHDSSAQRWAKKK